MLRFDDIVFGPIHSRRLGSSLGINLLPRDGKLCNFDCVYCECGWNADGRCHAVLPTTEQVKEALAAALTHCMENHIHVDSITFSGNGEPTIHPQFSEIVDVVCTLRDSLMPSAKISVLSNATMLDRKEVFVSLAKIDNPILKLDSCSDDDVKYVNRPSGAYSVRKVMDAMAAFEGNFILQTMFMKSKVANFDSTSRERVEAWQSAVRKLRPREIMAYTLDRETPDKTLEKVTVEEMEAIARPLVDEGFNVKISG